jgi:OmpA-OmpF porin, OOP family
LHENLENLILKNMKFTLLAASLMLLSSAASAEVYLGIGGGMTSSNAAERLEQSFIHDTVSRREKNDIGFQIYGGYAFNKFMAIEANYVDLGSYEFRGTNNTYDLQLSLKAKAYSLGLVGTVPLSESFGLDGKVGIARVSQTFHCTLNCGNVSDTTNISTTGVVALGAHWDITKNLRLRASYEHFGGAKYRAYDNAGDEAFKTVDYGLLSAGLAVRF